MQRPPLAALRSLIAESRIELPDALPPMAAGIFGYLGYDMVRLMEDLPRPIRTRSASRMPIMLRPTIIVVFDAVADSITIVTPVRPGRSVTAKRRACRAGERLAAIVDALDRPLDHAATTSAGPLTVLPPPIPPRPNIERMVRAAKEYIAAGDIFQVVLSQRFEAPFELPPFSLYRALRRVNPVALSLFFLDFGGFALAGSSPEILVKVRGGTVTIRPIAGTRPRGATPA